MLADIQFLQTKHKQTLGYRQVTMQLNRFYKKQGLDVVNCKRVVRLMRENDLLAIILRQNPYKKMWKATKEDKVSSNKLNRKFTTGFAGEKILTDISYLPCKLGFVYLSAAKDSVTREIVAHNVHNNLGLDLSLDILRELLDNKVITKPLIHSDKGVHYTAKRYRELLEKFGFEQSMSRRGKC